MRWLLFFSILLCPFRIFSEQRLHALIACDTHSDLRSSTKKDLAHLKTTLRKISMYTGLRLKMHVLIGNALTADNVNLWTKGIEKALPDVVVFYYSGHGCASQETLWPCLVFPRKRERFPSEALYKRLHSLRSRLVIILLDCCNNSVPSPIQGFVQRAKNASPCKTHLPGLKTLFLKTQGIIIAAGSAPGEEAFTVANGSLFTNSFVNALTSAPTKEQVSWKTIFERTAEACFPTQRPLFVLNVSPTGVSLPPGEGKREPCWHGKKAENRRCHNDANRKVKVSTVLSDNDKRKDC